MMADLDLATPVIEHDFILVLGGITHLDPPVMDAIFAAGCDDATPTLRAGVVSLLFSRPAPDLKAAVLTAIRDVKLARIGAEILRVDLPEDEPAAARTVGVINSVLDYQRHHSVDHDLTEEVLVSLGQSP